MKRASNIARRAAIATFLIACIGPLVAGWFYALGYSVGLVGALSDGFTGRHWAAVILAADTWWSVLLSAGLAVTAVAMSAAVALGLVLFWGDILERRARFFYILMAISPLVMAFLVFTWANKYGLITQLMLALGLISSPDHAPELVNDRLHVGVLAGMTLLTVPLFIVLLAQYRRTEQLPAMSRLARTLGASEWQVLFRVSLPLLLRKAAPNLIMSAVFLFGSYELPLLLGRQSPRMMSVLIAHKFRRFDLSVIPQAYALTLVYSAVVVVAALMAYRLASKKNHT